MRRNNLFWGVVVLLAGVLLLLNTLGLLAFDFWPIFWAIFLILVGAWFLLGPRLLRKEISEEQISIPLEGAGDADLRINHGAGRLTIRAASLPSELLSGKVAGGVEPAVTRSGNHLSVDLSMKGTNVIGPFPAMDFKGFNWDLSVNRDLPLRLNLSTGAGETNLDLSDALVKELRIETGASSTQVTLPARAGTTRVIAKAGMASLSFRIPLGVAARISTSVGLSGSKIDTNRFPRTGDVYLSPDFDSAANRVEIEVEAGMGSIDIA